MAKEFLLKAIKGNGKAEYALTTWYLYGKEVKKDLKKAVELLKKLADKNISEANFNLTVCFETGQGIKQDLVFKHYLKSALLGDKQSLYEVGRCYYHGIGVKKK